MFPDFPSWDFPEWTPEKSREESLSYSMTCDCSLNWSFSVNTLFDFPCRPHSSPTNQRRETVSGEWRAERSRERLLSYFFQVWQFPLFWLLSIYVHWLHCIPLHQLEHKERRNWLSEVQRKWSLFYYIRYDNFLYFSFVLYMFFDFATSLWIS